MKTKLILVMLSFIGVFKTPAQDLGLLWAKSMGGTSNDYGNCVAVDASGNVYTAGTFSGTADFNPGSGTFNLISYGSSDIFISKLDLNGNFVWAKQLGGTSYDNVTSIAIDANGNIYTAGSFSGTADFDPGNGTFNFTDAGNQDGFICKLDPSGSFLWAAQLGGADRCGVNDISIDANGNVLTIGGFVQTADFDPGLSTYMLASVGGTFAPNVFISKLSDSGNFIWAKAITGPGWVNGNGLTTDAAGNIYSTGNFNSNSSSTVSIAIDFDPGAGTSMLFAPYYEDIFVSKLDVSGNFVWAKQLGGGGPDYSNSINVDLGGNVITCGNTFGGDFDPGIGVFNLNVLSNNSCFISKLDGSGNFVWAKSITSQTAVGLASTVADSKLDANGNILLSGRFFGTIDFDPGIGTHLLTSLTPSTTSSLGVDRFLCKLGVSGDYQWAAQFGGTGNGHESSSLALDGNGFLYVTGFFSVSAAFDPNSTVHNQTSVGEWDAYVTKLCQNPPAKPIITVNGGPLFCIGTPITLNSSVGYSYLWSNGATSQNISVNGSGTYSVTVFNANGCSSSSNLTSLTFTTPPAFGYTITGMVVNFQNLSSASSFLWDFGNGNTSSINPNPTITYASAGTYGVCFKDNGNSCISCLNITVPGNGIGGVGLKENETPNLNAHIYPNPFSSRAILSVPDILIYGQLDFFIFDVTGAVSFQSKITDEKTEINRSLLSNGIYFYQIKANNKTLSIGKLIIEN